MRPEKLDPLAQLRRLAGDPQPSPSEEAAALARLRQAVAAAGTTGTEMRGRLGWLVPATAAVAVIIAAVAMSLVLRPSPAEAMLTEIAQASRRATPSDIPTGAFIYQQSDSVDLVVRSGSELGLDRPTVAYLLPSHREAWRQPATRFLQSATTTGPPTFFDEEVEAAYYSHGGAALDRVGETVFERSTDVTDPILETDWPTTADELRRALEERLAQGGDTRPLDVQLFGSAAEILRETASPQLRGAILEVLATLPVELLDRRSDGAITIALTYDRPPTTRDTLTIATDGTLIARSTTWLEPDPQLRTPAGTTISTTTHQPSRIVYQLPTS
jgi:hypothetical protein